VRKSDRNPTWMNGIRSGPGMRPAAHVEEEKGERQLEDEDDDPRGRVAQGVQGPAQDAQDHEAHDEGRLRERGKAEELGGEVPGVECRTAAAMRNRFTTTTARSMTPRLQKFGSRMPVPV
jgi:hypothetical protein